MTQYILNRLFGVADTNRGTFSSVPDIVITLSALMALSAVIQAGADITIEVLAKAHVFPPFPLRLEFLFLAIISAVLGIFTLQGLRRAEIDVTENALILNFLVESFLVISDVYFVYTYPDITDFMFWSRIPFIVLTTFNIAIVLYITWRMHIIGRIRGRYKD